MSEPSDFRNQAVGYLAEADNHHLQSLERQISAETHIREGEKDKAMVSLKKKHQQDKLASMKEKNANILNTQADNIENTNKIADILSRRKADPKMRKRALDRRINILKETNGIVDDDSQSPCWTPCVQKNFCSRWMKCDFDHWCEMADPTARKSSNITKKCSRKTKKRGGKAKYKKRKATYKKHKAVHKKHIKHIKRKKGKTKRKSTHNKKRKTKKK